MSSLALAVEAVVLILYMILRLVLRRVWGVKNNYKERKKEARLKMYTCKLIGTRRAIN